MTPASRPQSTGTNMPNANGLPELLSVTRKFPGKLKRLGLPKKKCSRETNKGGAGTFDHRSTGCTKYHTKPPRCDKADLPGIFDFLRIKKRCVRFKIYLRLVGSFLGFLPRLSLGNTLGGPRDRFPRPQSGRTAEAIVDGPPQAGFRNLFRQNEFRLRVIQGTKAGE